MSTFRFLHAADVHLDSPMRGVARYEGAPVAGLRDATRRAFENLVDFAIKREVACVLLAGDLYDGDWKDFNTGLFFTAQAARLADAGIDTYVIAGNHDAASRITHSLRLPERVRVFSTDRPETYVDESNGIALHGQGFAKRAESRNLAARYPAAMPDLFNIGLLHTSLDGRPGHAPYAPCSVDDLRARGYDYWALGHVHRREVVAENPHIVFPGNLQGRSVRETGPKGATEVSVVDGRIEGLIAHALDVARWRVDEVDVSPAGSVDDALDAACAALDAAVEAEDRDLVVVRLRLVGASAASEALRADPDSFVAECRAHALRLGGLCLEKVVIETRPAAQASALGRDDALGELLRGIAELDASAPEVHAVRDDLTPLLAALPTALRRETDVDALLASALDDARALLLSRLGAASGSNDAGEQ